MLNFKISKILPWKCAIQKWPLDDFELHQFSMHFNGDGILMNATPLFHLKLGFWSKENFQLRV